MEWAYYSHWENLNEVIRQSCCNIDRTYPDTLFVLGYDSLTTCCLGNMNVISNVQMSDKLGCWYHGIRKNITVEWMLFHYTTHAITWSSLYHVQDKFDAFPRTLQLQRTYLRTNRLTTGNVIRPEHMKLCLKSRRTRKKKDGGGIIFTNRFIHPGLHERNLFYINPNLNDHVSSLSMHRQTTDMVV